MRRADQGTQAQWDFFVQTAADSVETTSGAFKLTQAAQDRWRAVNAPHLVALVRAGATVMDGTLVERPEPEDMMGSQEAACGQPPSFPVGDPSGWC